MAEMPLADIVDRIPTRLAIDFRPVNQPAILKQEKIIKKKLIS